MIFDFFPGVLRVPTDSVDVFGLFASLPGYCFDSYPLMRLPKNIDLQFFSWSLGTYSCQTVDALNIVLLMLWIWVATYAVARLSLRSQAVRSLIASAPALQPNSWSILRIVLGFLVAMVAPAVFFGDLPASENLSGRAIVAWVLVFAMCTDFVDGMIARACGLVSETGKWLDPLADKLVCLPLFAVMAWHGRIDPEWVVVLVLADTVGTVGRPWLTASATLWGKLKTCLAFGLVVWCMILPHADSWSRFDGLELVAGWSLAALAVASVISKIPALRR